MFHKCLEKNRGQLENCTHMFVQMSSYKHCTLLVLPIQSLGLLFNKAHLNLLTKLVMLIASIC